MAQGLPPGLQGFVLGQQHVEQQGRSRQRGMLEQMQMNEFLRKSQEDEILKAELSKLGPNPSSEALEAVVAKRQPLEALKLRQSAKDREAQRQLLETLAGRNIASRENIAANRPAPASAERPVAVLGPDGKPEYVRAADAIGRQPYSPSIAGGGELKPETLAFTAKQYLSGDRQAVQGYARNATARIALQNAIVDEAGRQGKSPEQVASLMAEYAGLTAGSRTIGQRAANISLAATEAQEMIGVVQDTSEKFSRTSFVPWNMALRAYESGTGSPEIAAFGASLNALVNVYARAINPTGVPTVSDKEHARAVINSVQSPAQVKAVLDVINRELEIAKKAPSQVRGGIREAITGTAPAAPAGGVPAGVDAAVWNVMTPQEKALWQR